MSYDTTTDAGAGTDTAGMWPEGQYDGTLESCTLVTSQLKGTPGMKLAFKVQDREVYVDIWITEASAAIAQDQLAILGWNGDFNYATFNPPALVSLYMKHETYKGKPKERWNISVFASKPPPSPKDDALVRFAARYKAQHAAPPAPPKAAPKPPPSAKPGRPVAATNGTAPKINKPGRPTAKPVVDEKAGTEDEAWNIWVAHKAASETDGTAFWATVDTVRGDTLIDAMPAEMWQQVANGAPPF